MPKRTEAKPWEQQEGESNKAFEAFTVYLEMGPERSVRAVGQKLDKSRTLIGRWSVTYGWVERAAAWDADILEKAHAAAVKKKAQMTERHLSISWALQDKAMEALKQTRPEDIDPKNLLAFLREATKMEREAREETIRATDPHKEEAKGNSSLADVIVEAWERRQNDEPNK